MKFLSLVPLSLLFGPLIASASSFAYSNSASDKPISFTENKGQVVDQLGRKRHDILYGGNAGELSFHLRKTGISYQLYNHEAASSSTVVSSRYTVYRLDLTWLSCSGNPSVRSAPALDGSMNFFTSGSAEGIQDVRSYPFVHYQQIYPGIDVKWYSHNNNLKYDYLLAPGVDYKIIRMKIAGAQTVKLNKKGELVITTPLGSLIEQPPVVFQDENELVSSWLVENDVISFKINNVDPSKPLRIDPCVRVWGTYYGSSADEYATSCVADKNSNVYMAGYTNTSSTLIATSGAHQTNSNGNTDAFLVKFNSNGQRQWATFYGGASNDIAYSCVIDTLGNIFIAGITESTGPLGTISTSNAHQPLFGGTRDGFIAQFNSSGIRQWATYYGGAGNDEIYSCAIDKNNNIYVCGGSFGSASTIIATPGSHNTGATNGAGYLAKFSNSGTRLWATFYGNNQSSTPSQCAVDGFNNVYIAGVTNSSLNAGIATNNAHQGSYGGSTDAFVGKFNSQGVYQWGTYYGSSGQESHIRCAADSFGNIFLSGVTQQLALGTGTIIATANSHQPASISNYDSFLVKFDSVGTRKWGTYYGGGLPSTHTHIYSCTVDKFGSVYIAGSSAANNGIATSGSYQTFGGGFSGNDGFLAKFNTWGKRQWGTYYGGGSPDAVNGSAHAPNGIIYICGTTRSGSGAMASPGSYQPQHANVNANDAWIAKMYDCYPDPPINITSPSSLFCSGKSALLAASAGTNAISWYNNQLDTVAIATGSLLITGALSVGTYTYYSEANGCAASVVRTPFAFTVIPSPTISVSSGTVCQGQSFTLSPSGASVYSVNGSPQLIVTPSVTTTYSVVGTATNGCAGNFPAIVNIGVSPLPTISVNSGSVCSGNAFTIVPAGAQTYSVQGNQFTVTPATTSSYSLTGTSANGCAAAAPVIASVSVLPLPQLAANVSPAVICRGNIIALTVSGASTYSWSGLGTANSFTIIPANSQTYHVTGTTINGCSSDTIVIATVNPLPIIALSASSSTVCQGESVQLTATGGSTYSWSTSGSGPFLQVIPSGTKIYTVTGADTNNCSSTATVLVIADPCTSLGSHAAPLKPRVYPNPAQEYIYISCSLSANIEIRNDLGQLLIRQSLIPGENKLAVDHLAHGMYFLLISSEQVLESTIFIKE